MVKRFVLGLGLMAACGDNRHHHTGVVIDGAMSGDATILDARQVDGHQADAMADAMVDAMADAPPGVGPFGTPGIIVLVPGIGVDDDPSMTSDLLELYFNRENDIFVAKRASVGAQFGLGVKIAEVSSSSNETGPSVSGDGLTLYFASDRAPTLGFNDIWEATRASRSNPWGARVHVTELSSAADDSGIAVTNDNKSVVFASDRTAGNGGLFLSTRAQVSAAWGTPVLLSAVQQASRQNSPMLSDDGLSLTWDINFGNGGDFYGSTRATTSAAFGTPALLSDLSSPTADDNDLWISADGHHCVFLSNRGGSTYSFYEAAG